MAERKSEILALLARPSAPATLTAPSRGIAAANQDKKAAGKPPTGVAGTQGILRYGEPGWEADYRIVNTAEHLDHFLLKLGRQRRIVIDLETTGLEHDRARIVGLAFSWRPCEAWYLPLLGPEGEMILDYDATLQQLQPVLEDPNVTKVNQNIKFDWLVLQRHGIHMAGVRGDTMVADYLLRAGEYEHGQDALALHYLQYRMIPITELIGKKRSTSAPPLTMDKVPTQQVAIYAGEDADVALRLDNILVPKLRERGLEGLYHDLEVPLVEVLATMEYHGIRVDVDLLGELSRELAPKVESLQQEIYVLAGHPFNIGSPPQLRKVLFEELKLPVQKATDTGEASTDAETLEKLAALDHALPAKLQESLPAKLQEYRGLAKLKSTYLDALPKMVSPVTGRLHTSLNQAVAVTGRLSSSNPNLQNIPARSEEGMKIRRAFLAEIGWLLLKADYSQIELRVLAHFCGDEELRRAYYEDKDIHAMVAAQINNVPESEVTKAMRTAVKTVNFGVIYGMTPHGLAIKLKIPKEEEAASFIDSYYARYPRVAAYQDELLAECRRTGYVSTILGRQRRLYGIRAESSWHDRNRPEREAINTQIQGSAADLIKLAMVSIHQRLRRAKLKARMLLQVHDELVFEVPPDEKEALAVIVREEMEGALTLAVPLKADLAIGPNWLDMEPLGACGC
jgi:DNA polymerase-1